MKKAVLALIFASGAAYAAAPVQSINSNTAVQSQIKELERVIKARGAAQVNLQQQISDLQEEVSELRGIAESHAYKLEQIVDRQRELYIEIERRLTAAQPAAVDAIPDSTDATEAPADSYGGSLSENEAYDRAVNMILKDRKYDAAIPEFQGFISQFPNSIYIANAHYWLGQLLFNKAQYQEARDHFDKVIRFYPDSNKRPDAILKQGTVLQKLGDEAGAKALFEKVISEYPESNSATLAKSRLAGNG
jgi:tol-pal system protein YbgF